MSYSGRFLSWLNRCRLSETATLTSVTGTACPCMTSRDASNPSYSEEWHRNNSGEDDCNGTGLIDTTTVTTTFKAIFSPPGLVGTTIPNGTVLLQQIGEVTDDDLFMWGAVNSSTLAAVSFDGLSEYNDYITKDSIKYAVRDVVDLPGSVGQVAVLVRRNA